MLESGYKNESPIEVIHGKISHWLEYESGLVDVAIKMNNGQGLYHYNVPMEVLEKHKLAYRDKDNRWVLRKLPENTPVILTFEFGRVAKIQRKDN